MTKNHLHYNYPTENTCEILCSGNKFIRIIYNKDDSFDYKYFHYKNGDYLEISGDQYRDLIANA